MLLIILCKVVWRISLNGESIPNNKSVLIFLHMLLKLSRLYFPPSVDHFLVLLYLVINSSVCLGFCENFVDVLHRFLEELHEGWLGITNIV